MQRPPLPETITLSGEQAYEIMALLLGADEFFCEIDSAAPARVGEDFLTWGTRLGEILFGDDPDTEDDREYDTHPGVVERYAAASERAALMLSELLADAVDSSLSYVYDIPVSEATKSRDKLRAQAVAMRLAGDIDLGRVSGTEADDE